MFLERFHEAQAGRWAGYDTALAEIRAGQKRSHWIWYIFPQIQGLGRSATAQIYAIASRAEAVAYLEHPVLGPRLRECTKLVLDVEGRSAEQIFGYPDHLKFRSCMTLFARAAETVTGAVGAHAPGRARSADEAQPFREALEKYFAGEGDALTLQLLTSACGT